MLDILYYSDGIRSCTLDELEKVKHLPLWVDVIDITRQEAERLAAIFNLHPLTVEDLVNANVRIKVEEFPDYLLCVFYGMHHGAELDLHEIDFLLGKNFLITSHKQEIPSFSLLKYNKEKLEQLFKRENEFVFHKLLDAEIDNYFPTLHLIDDEIEEIEEKVTNGSDHKMLRKILAIKRKLVLLKKVVYPQREKISFLAKDTYPTFISKKALPYFRDAYDQSIRVADAVENYREAISNTFDIHMSSVSNEMNQVMKVLSIITAIALPFTVISGVYGTNFTLLPGSDYPMGFWIMVIAMVTICIGMLAAFRRRNWI